MGKRRDRLEAKSRRFIQTMPKQSTTAFAHAQLLPAAPLESSMAVPHFLETILDRPIAYHRVFFTLTGSIKAALFLSQAIYWSKRVKNPEGWFFKYQDEWFEETGLTRREQEAARSKLRQSGILEEERKGTPAKLFFRVNFETLSNELSSLHQAEITKTANQGCTKPPIKDVQKRQSRMHEKDNQESTKGANKIEQNSQPFLIEQRLHAETTAAGLRARAHEEPPPAAELRSVYPLETIREFVKEMKPHATTPEGLAVHLQRSGKDDLQIAGWLAEREEVAAADAKTAAAAAQARRAMDDQAREYATTLIRQGSVRDYLDCTALAYTLEHYGGIKDASDYNSITYRQLKKLVPSAISKLTDNAEAALAYKDALALLKNYNGMAASD